MISAFGGGLVEDSSLIVRRVCDLPVALFVSPAYLQRRGTPRSPMELLSHSCAAVRFGTGPQAPWRFKSANDSPFELTPKTQLTTTDPESVIDFALADAGIVQASLLQGLPHLRTGALKLLLPEMLEGNGREFVMYYPHRLHLALRVRVVVDALMEHFRRSKELHLTMRDIVGRFPACVAN